MITTTGVLFLAGIAAAAGPAPVSAEISLEAAFAQARVAVADAAVKDYNDADSLALTDTYVVLRMRFNFDSVAVRAGTRPGDQAVRRDFEALMDLVPELESDLRGLDHDLAGLASRASQLASVKDRVALLPNVFTAVRDNLRYIQQQAFIRSDNFRREGLTFELSRFERDIQRLEAAAQKCLDSSVALKAAVEASHR